MAAAPARRASGVPGARTVSAGEWEELLGPAEPRRPPLLAPAECERGFFGPGCRQACVCPLGSACDPVSGECGRQCPAGYRGTDCDQGECLALRARVWVGCGPWGPSRALGRPAAWPGWHLCLPCPCPRPAGLPVPVHLRGLLGVCVATAQPRGGSVPPASRWPEPSGRRQLLLGAGRARGARVGCGQ